jgi:predicted nucleic acid-binding protein
VRKHKVYLDTSIISYYYADDVPKEQQITRDFLMELIAGNNYEVYVSTVVLEEIKRCKTEEKQNQLNKVIEKLNPIILDVTTEIADLANLIIKEGAIPAKNNEDAYHIAFSLFHEIDYLVSWNFSHIVKTKTKRVVSIVALKEGYRDIQIISPLEGL